MVTSSHLIDEHAQCPPIHCLAVPPAQDDLGCDVLWRSTKRPRSSFHLLGKLKTGDLEVAAMVQQKIARCQIPEDHVQAVKVVKCKDNLGSIEAAYFLTEPSCMS